MWHIQSNANLSTEIPSFFLQCNVIQKPLSLSGSSWWGDRAQRATSNPQDFRRKGREVLGIFLGSIIKEREEWLGWALYKPHLFITPRSVTFSFTFLRCPHPHWLLQSLVQLSSPLFLHHYTPWLKDTPCHTYWAAQTHPWTPPTGARSTGERLNMPEPTKKGENEFCPSSCHRSCSLMGKLEQKVEKCFRMARHYYNYSTKSRHTTTLMSDITSTLLTNMLITN